MSPSKSKSPRRPTPKNKKRAGQARGKGGPRRGGPRKAAAPAVEAEQQRAAGPAENAAALALARKIASLASDKKALDISILDVRGMTSYADYLVLASGESDRQVTAIADHVEEKLKEQGVRPLGTEGRETGSWVLLDYGEVVVHLFFTEVRAAYDLDGLWADAPREKVA
jgi:ribosome-associated protein